MIAGGAALTRTTGRVTQKEIARIAGVSQTAVSQILNGSPSAIGRISEATRTRVIKVIEETGYVADPVARRMVNRNNRILGVFTYEPAFPSAQTSFYAPLLQGVEEAAERLEYNLLLLTAANRGTDGARRIFDRSTQLRLADGCIILGSRFNRDELARLVAGNYPYVAVGRRDDAGGPVRYIGAEYKAPTEALVRKARALGHRRLAYLYPQGPAEALADRWQGFLTGMAGDAQVVVTQTHLPIDADAALERVVREGATAVFIGMLQDAVQFRLACRARGLRVPEDLSIVVLGNHGGVQDPQSDFTSFHVPRVRMARKAAEMLVELIEGRTVTKQQKLLECDLIEGKTLGPAA